MEIEQQPKKDLDLIFQNPAPILAALRLSFLEAVRQHRMNGVPMVFWQDGNVIEVPADQLSSFIADCSQTPQ
jgi:hypothetical protein